MLRKKNLGFVFQSFNLIDELTVHENVELPLAYIKIPSHERKTRVEAVLEKMDLQSRSRHFEGMRYQQWGVPLKRIDQRSLFFL